MFQIFLCAKGFNSERITSCQQIVTVIILRSHSSPLAQRGKSSLLTTLLSTDDYSIIGIGFGHVDYPLSGMPGWKPVSWGYHGDDGKKFDQIGGGTDYGPTYGAGNVVGCGVNFTTNSAFFTRNGQYLGKQRGLTPAGDAANVLL